MKRKACGALACLVVGAGLASLTPAPAQANPVSGNGMWIWYVDRSGGNAKTIATRAKAHHVRTVFIKSADANNRWSQFAPGLIRRLHEQGLRVCGWQFVYGDRPGPEARAGAEAKAAGADCLIIDAETSYEGRYAAADKYMTMLRDAVGRRFPLALSSFPYADYHPALPYSVFLRRGGAKFNLPQMYWRAIGTSVKNVFAHTYLWNAPYHRPIYPVGQTYQEPPPEQLRAFRRQARVRRAKGVSWWSWQETNDSEFNAIGKRLEAKRRPRPAPAFPRLARHTRGDLVILVQELLRAAGHRVAVDGDLGAKTRRALKRFQTEHHQKADGILDLRLWRALLKRRPEPTSWWHPGQRVRAKSGTAAPAAPLSARLDALDLEFTPPPR